MLRPVSFFWMLGHCIVLCAQSPSLAIDPPVITQCNSGRGAATLSWNFKGSGFVQIRIGGPQGVPMTGLEVPTGTAQTGDWVSNGLVFVLVNEAGMELARATAKVSCGASSDPLDTALAASSWFPLQVGNQWIYQYDSRLSTSTYLIWTISGTVQFGEQTYFVLSSLISSKTGTDIWLRTDAVGRVYRIPDITKPKEELWLDPTANPDPSAVLRVQVRNYTYTGALGTFSGGLTYDRLGGGLIHEAGTFVRGIGLVESTSTLLTGSSGGFTDGMKLVSMHIGKALQLSTVNSTIQLGTESTQLDVTNKKVTNCAIPCYFPACGLGGFSDPPNTYKPCFQTRFGVQQPMDGSTLTAEIELRDPSDKQVFQTTVPLAPVDGQTEFTFFQQVPLYTTPNQPFAPGNYRLNGRLKRNGDDAGSATVPIRIQ